METSPETGAAQEYQTQPISENSVDPFATAAQPLRTEALASESLPGDWPIRMLKELIASRESPWFSAPIKYLLPCSTLKAVPFVALPAASGGWIGSSPE